MEVEPVKQVEASSVIVSLHLGILLLTFTVPNIAGQHRYHTMHVFMICFAASHFCGMLLADRNSC